MVTTADITIYKCIKLTHCIPLNLYNVICQICSVKKREWWVGPPLLSFSKVVLCLLIEAIKEFNLLSLKPRGSPYSSINERLLNL